MIAQNVDRLRKTGNTSISNTAARALTWITTSGAGTTYTKTNVTDAGAWDLSGASIGDVLKSADGYEGIVTAANDVTDVVTCDEGWQAPTGQTRQSLSNIKPTDGQAVTIHHLARAKQIVITADPDNTDTVYVALHGTCTTGDYPLVPGKGIVFKAAPGKWLDVTEIFCIAASGTQTVHWAYGATGSSGDVAVSINMSGPFTVTQKTIADGDTTPSISGGTAFVTGNTNPTTITNFDNGAAGGQLYFIKFNDGNTTIQNNANIKLQGAANFIGAQYDTMCMFYDGSIHMEVSRSVNS